MENRFYIKELDSYQKASDLSKERMGTNPNYDLELLPTFRKLIDFHQEIDRNDNMI